MDINEYVVRGNTVLDNRAIEAAVYPFLGPQRSLGDIEGARDALQAAYRRRASRSTLELPEQQVSGGVVCRSPRPLSVASGGRRQALFAGGVARGSAGPGGRARYPTSPRSSASWRRSTTPRPPGAADGARGQRPGTMDVDLQVEDKNPWHASIGLNNDYSADTRHLRSVVSLGYDNLLATRPRHLADLFHRAAGPRDAPRSGPALPRAADLALERAAVRLPVRQRRAKVGSMNVVGQGHSYGVAAIYSLPVTGLWSHSLLLRRRLQGLRGTDLDRRGTTTGCRSNGTPR